MPHSRERYGGSLIARALAHSPIAGIIGQRQVGKTTLAESLAAEYVTFDDAKALLRAREDPGDFLAGRGVPFVIDECQLCPPLFPALKERVRTHRGRGRFLLTGSVRFTSRKAIKESLTGRIAVVEILPMTLSEAHQKPLSDFCIRLLAARSERALEHLLEKGNPAPWCGTEMAADFLSTGGLPGICFNRASHLRREKWADHLDTLLDRDLRLIVETSIPLPSLRYLVQVLAEAQGEPLDLSRLSRKTRISRVTLPRLLYALEGIFVIRRYRSSGGLGAPVIYFEDQGMVSYLKKQERAGPLNPEHLIRLAHACILPQFSYRRELLAEFSAFRTRGGALVPFVIRTARGSLGLLAAAGKEASPGELGSARSFLRTHRRAKALVLTTARQPRVISPDLVEVPVTWAL